MAHTQIVKCQYCNRDAILTSSQAVYNRPGFGDIWLCSGYPSCDAYVGTHRDGTPKGSLANKELRMWRKNAHTVFDAIWKSGKTTRTKAYKWLSSQMGLDPKYTHIGMFDIDQCKQVIKLVRKA